MNHIKQLTADRDRYRAMLHDVENRLRELEGYLLSNKFHNADYVHVRTDMLPKISAIRSEIMS